MAGTSEGYYTATADGGKPQGRVRQLHQVLAVKTDELAWRSPYPSQRPPLLKLSVPNPSRRPNLETIPGSPPYGQADFAINPPAFSLPSESAVRREKLVRGQFLCV